MPTAVDSSSDAVVTEGDSPAPPGPSKTKRERKTKFNVREVLNLKETSPKVAKASPSTKTSSSSKQSKSDSPPSLLDGVNSEPYERSDKVFDADTVTAAVEEVGQEEVGGGGDIEVVDLSESFDVKSEAGCGVSETGSEGTPSEKENINSDNGVREHGGQGRALTNGGTNGVSEVREIIMCNLV